MEQGSVRARPRIDLTDPTDLDGDPRLSRCMATDGIRRATTMLPDQFRSLPLPILPVHQAGVI